MLTRRAEKFSAIKNYVTENVLLIKNVKVKETILLFGSYTKYRPTS